LILEEKSGYIGMSFIKKLKKKTISELRLLYNLKADQLQYLGGFDNFVYEITQPNSNSILRVGFQKPKIEIEAEIDWILYLHNHGIQVSPPLHSPQGNYIETLTQDTVSLMVVNFEKAPGKFINKKNDQEWNPTLWKSMGNVLGSIHELTRDYRPNKNLEKCRNFKNQIYSNLDVISSTNENQIILNLFQDHWDEISTFPRNKDSYGLIHYDFHALNFFVDNQGFITLLDFDDSCYFWFIADIAITLYYSGWGVRNNNRESFTKDFFRAFWTGYYEKHKLNRDWLSYIPNFLRMRDFTLYFALQRSYNEKTISEWQNEIRERLRKRILKNKSILPIQEKEWIKIIE
jgi:Ser/Thr protein kinase RdoA (MazF antagonist)